jgi:hypothetical protein
MIACLSTDIMFVCTCDYVRGKCVFCIFFTNKKAKYRIYLCKLVGYKLKASHRENDCD